MLESFLVAFNAVAPFLILLGIGFAAVRLKWTDRPFMDRLNALNYKLFFPFLMFNNVYSAKPENMPSVKLMLTGALSVSLLVVLLVLIVPKIVKGELHDKSHVLFDIDDEGEYTCRIEEALDFDHLLE